MKGKISFYFFKQASEILKEREKRGDKLILVGGLF